MSTEPDPAPLPGILTLTLYGGPLDGDTFEIHEGNLSILPFISFDLPDGKSAEYRNSREDLHKFVWLTGPDDPRYEVVGGGVFDDDGNMLAEVDSPEEAMDILDLLERAEGYEGAEPEDDDEALLVHKACACVFRQTPAGPQILVFAHPLAGWQLPKGTVEPGEELEEAVLRELREESGLSQSRVIAPMGTFKRQVGGGPQETSGPEFHLWHLFHVKAEITHETWTHIAEGSAEEDGLAFAYFWLPVPDEGALGEFYPVWTEPFALIRAYLREKSGDL